MDLEELLRQLKDEADELEVRIKAIERLIRGNFKIKWGLWVTAGPFGFHVYASSKFAMIQENDDTVRLLVDNVILDIPKGADVDVQIMPMDELPDLEREEQAA